MAKVSLRAYNRDIETMIDRGHLDEAIANCRHILKTFPKHLETYRLLGKAYLEYKRFPEAVDIFSRVLAAVPDDFVANVGMSIIRDEENKLDDAIWHMERAFETQPSNAAIQSELQRLYGRRDGVQPPRIRMTRGALAHMYVQGELYPQAISEIKSVLKEDGGRVDMQALLARAYYRSGLKNEAADMASAVLRTYSYCLDANRVLMEILGSDRSESAQIYRQRVVELDPYAAHVMGTVFQSNEAPEAAVNVERLDWNGQPVGLQPDWGTTQAITLEESGVKEEQPDWLRSVFDEPPTQPPPQLLRTPTDQPAAVPPFDFDTSAPSAPTADSKEDLPDFLRAAGWGQSTGAFDESKSTSGYEEPVTEPPLAKGDLPDWVKAMAPVESQQSSEAEELPDWINKIGTGASQAPADSDNQLDWIRQLDQPAPAQPSDDQSDWLKQMDSTEQPAASASDAPPDWLKGFGTESESTPSSRQTEEPDWMSQPAQPQPEAQTSDDQLDWLKQLDQPEQPVSAPAEEQPDWLKGFGSESELPQTGELDWLKQIEGQAEPPAPQPASLEVPVPGEMDENVEPVVSEQPPDSVSTATEPGFPSELTQDQEAQEPAVSTPISATMDTDKLGTSEQERDDSFAWLENLAARQGATEGLLTTPEERMEEEPDWVKRAKGLSTDDIPTQPTPTVQPSGSIEELGKTEQERDDSFAWLESLAARQGASEGLLTKPEERMEEEPDWVKRAKDIGAVAEQPPISSPQPAAEEPASDDTGVWLRSLEEESASASTSAPSGDTDATGIWLKSLDEGLVEMQREKSAQLPESELPSWLQTNDDEQATEASAPAAAMEESAAEGIDWMRSVEETAEVPPAQPIEQPEPEIPAWMQNVEVEEEKTSESEPAMPISEITADTGEIETEQSTQFDELPVETQSTEMEAQQPAEASGVAVPDVEAERPAQLDDLPEWMQFIEDKETAEEGVPAVQEEKASDVSEWMGFIEEPAAPSPSLEPPKEELKVKSEDIPAWLSSLDKEEAQATTPAAADADLPAWLRGEEGAAPEPAALEPTRATDWQPVDQEQPEPSMPVPEEIPGPVEVAEETLEPVVSSLEEQEVTRPALEPEPPKEPVAPIDEALSTMPVDPILARARDDLAGGDVSGALNTYGKLIRKTRLLDEVIYDLREALYRYPVDVGIWQSLGDAYMRANRLQDALDAYTKAEELLR